MSQEDRGWRWSEVHLELMDLCDFDQQPDIQGQRGLAYLIPSVVRMSGFIGGGADKLPLFPV